MICHDFSNGGRVCHGVLIDGRSHSVWLDAYGKLIDAEMFDRCQRPRPIRPGSPRWQRLARLLERRIQREADAAMDAVEEPPKPGELRAYYGFVD